jgi:hypothetical protein
MLRYTSSLSCPRLISCFLVQVGKAWLAVARMHHSLGEAGGGAEVLQRASLALKRALAVCTEAARAVGTQCQCEPQFAALQNKLDGGGRGKPAEQQEPCKAAELMPPPMPPVPTK